MGIAFKWIHTVCDLAYLLSFILHVFEVNLWHSVCQYFIHFYGWLMLHWMVMPQFVYQCAEDVISTPWLMWIVPQWTFVPEFLFEYLFSILLGLHLGEELLGHMVVLCLTFWEIANLLSIAAVPFYISTSKVQGFLFLYVPDNTNYFLFLIFKKITTILWVWSISYCFDSHSPMTSDIEHLFMYVLAICISVLENCLLVLCLYLNWVVCLLVAEL